MSTKAGQFQVDRHILPISVHELRQASDSRLESFEGDEFHCKGIKTAQFVKQLSQKAQIVNPPHFLYIKDAYSKSSDLRFLSRNFGVLPQTSDYVEAFKDTDYEVVDVNNHQDKLFLEKLVASYSRIVTPLDMCDFSVSRHLDLPYFPFAEGFHLVVGDSPHDALYAWNRGAFFPSYQGRTTLWIPEGWTADPEIILAVSKWIEKGYWDHQHRQGKIISYSYPSSSLIELSKKLSDLCHFHFEPISLEKHQYPMPNESWRSRKEHPFQEQISISGRKGLAEVAKPQIVIGSGEGVGWIVDVAVQHRPEAYKHTNLRPNWELPRRRGLPDQFFPARACRINRDGLFSIGVGGQERNIAIEIPSDHTIFFKFLDSQFDGYRYRDHGKPRFYHLATSNDGQKLQGMIRLFGGLWHCGRFFEDPYCRLIVDDLSGKPESFFDARIVRLSKLSSDFQKDNPVPPSAPIDDWLSSFLGYIARSPISREPAPQELTVEEFKNRFNKLSKGNGRRVEWDYQKEDLQSLLDDEILIQGSRISCPSCGSTFWYRVDELASKVTCRGCYSNFPLILEPRWSLRLNDLVTNALRSSGVLPVLQALYQRSSFLSGMFTYLPSQNIYPHGDYVNPFTDIDVLMIANQKLILGEVKASPELFTEGDFEKMTEVAMIIQPHELIFAAPGESWPNAFGHQIKKIADLLKPYEVEVKPWLLKWRE